ncbi:NAD(P)-binding protein [Mycobacterium sp. MYCO198283]|uniref:NAD(P)-binding protein n=1 Tax=Mycobacterium sp. MYCO198283 TaxID=2883505 RepID=UPI001E575B2C|nr:NAD(P)-binding protein [Mycobacterium sp. MYCO198283]MCG5431330.1 NAD(P)-binding protein [Mycobacterium sp. MYCO198283]
MPTLQADYLVIGAGAVGMAFLDTLVTESEATVVVVDRGDQPGGHWNTAYPFVRLHQPSAYYGVNSLRLDSGRIDTDGLNAGMYELATANEIRAYFDRVMRALIATGRVSYFPMSEYDGDGRFTTLAGEQYTVDVARRVVDTTYSNVVVPSMRPPAWSVAPRVTCVAVNLLPATARGHDRYVIVGGGKTGMDALLWLLRHGISPDRITWIVARDAWLLDRANVQPGAEFVEQFRASVGARTEAIMAATSVPDLYARLEAGGVLLRLDTNVEPTMYRCATVTQAEVAQLRRVTDVVRLGHVRSIETDRIELTGGTVPADAATTLFVDATSDGLRPRPELPVFDGPLITPQSVRACQQIFSAAFIAHVELAYADDAVRNDLCQVIRLPYHWFDWIPMTHGEQRNEIRWSLEPELMDWLVGSRLNVLAELFRPALARPRVRDRAMEMMRGALTAANEKLEALAAELGADHQIGTGASPIG